MFPLSFCAVAVPDSIKEIANTLAMARVLRWLFASPMDEENANIFAIIPLLATPDTHETIDYEWLRFIMYYFDSENYLFLVRNVKPKVSELSRLAMAALERAIQNDNRRQA